MIYRVFIGWDWDDDQPGGPWDKRRVDMAYSTWEEARGVLLDWVEPMVVDNCCEFCLANAAELMAALDKAEPGTRVDGYIDGDDYVLIPIEAVPAGWAAVPPQ